MTDHGPSVARGTQQQIKHLRARFALVPSAVRYANAWPDASSVFFNTVLEVPLGLAWVC